MYLTMIIFYECHQKQLIAHVQNQWHKINTEAGQRPWFNGKVEDSRQRGPGFDFRELVVLLEARSKSVQLQAMINAPNDMSDSKQFAKYDLSDVKT